MFKVKINRGRKYLLAVGILLLAAGAVFRFWPQIENISGAGSDILIKEKRIAKYRRMVQTGDNLEAEVVFLKKELKKSESGLLTGKTSALAAAEIQKVLQEVAEKSQVEIKTVRVLKAEGAEGCPYLNVPVQLSIFSTIRHLKEFLYKIMTSAKYLTVKKVAISVRRTLKGEQERVSADITVNGFLKRTEE